ncbi:MAG TPA: ABC transporter permease [Gemmatimonadaceae bacterium]|nr:ABC transporter permease [Gemmatimonadaceae bacterium]
MPFLEAIRLAFAQIRVQKLKSFFTLLGVMIGVMFLIAVVSIVEGMSKYMEEDFAGKMLGVNSFTLRRRPNANFGNVSDAQWREYQRRPLIYKSDVDLVRPVLPGGVHASVENMTFAYATTSFARPRQVQAVGAEASYFDIKGYKLTAGRTFTSQEVSYGSRVIVIGTEVAEHFFPALDPLGRALRIGGVPYQVVGLLEKQGSLFGFSLDRLAIAPWTSPISRATNPRGDIDGFLVKAPNAVLLAEAMEETRSVMRASRRLAPAVPDNFALESSESALTFFARLKGQMVAFGTALPAIGLIVGAIVIMNIMLVAVAERTREIGIRKALGAKRRDIMRQFLVESASLSVLGAALGITLGIGMAKIVSAVSPLPARVAPWSIPMAVLLGAGVGIVAGLYPASRAARLDPIAALRQE